MTSRSHIRGRTRTTALAVLSAALCGTLALTGCTHHSSRTKSRHGISKHRTSSTSTHRSTSTRSSSSRSRCYLTDLTFSLYQRPSIHGEPREVLQAHNKSHSACRLQYRPLIAFTTDPEAAKQPLPANEDSQGAFEGGILTLSPGRDAYATFPVQNTSGKGTLVSKETRYVYVSPGGSDSHAPSWHALRLGARSFRVDGTSRMTYWMSSRAQALTY